MGYAKASITPVVRSILVSIPRLMGHGKSYDRGGRGVFYGVLALRENRDKMKEQIYTLLKSHLKTLPVDGDERASAKGIEKRTRC